jgi:hypothetical protein
VTAGKRKGRGLCLCLCDCAPAEVSCRPFWFAAPPIPLLILLLCVYFPPFRHPHTLCTGMHSLFRLWAGCLESLSGHRCSTTNTRYVKHLTQRSHTRVSRRVLASTKALSRAFYKPTCLHHG